jgi:CheY-like chemotaxis protein
MNRGLIRLPAAEWNTAHRNRFARPCVPLRYFEHRTPVPFRGDTMRQKRLTRPIALLVEVDQELRALVATLLEESGMHVIECDSAEAALAVFAMKGDDMAMVVTDVELAGRLDGVALAQNLEANHPDVPVIVMSVETSARADELPDNVIQLGRPWRPLDMLIAAERARRAA